MNSIRKLLGPVVVVAKTIAITMVLRKCIICYLFVVNESDKYFEDAVTHMCAVTETTPYPLCALIGMVYSQSVCCYQNYNFTTDTSCVVRSKLCVAARHNIHYKAPSLHRSAASSRLTTDTLAHPL
jgi:hypothetical protein